MDLLAGQGTLKSLLQHHSSKASILWRSAFFIVQLSHPHMTIGKTIALTRWISVGKVMSLLFSMLSRLVIVFLPRKRAGQKSTENCFGYVHRLVQPSPLSTLEQFFFIYITKNNPLPISSHPSFPCAPVPSSLRQSQIYFLFPQIHLF